MATGSQAGDGQTPPPRPPARTPKHARSACEKHRDWIEAQVALGRNAQAIYQDLVEQHAFEQRYNSVKRFVHRLRVRDPQRFDVLESAPGEEAQVDFGLGAPTLTASGKHRRPYLFVMTLKYSGKSFRKVAWKADQQTWARLHEEAFRTFGGAVAYAVLDNLKSGVLRPDLYDPELNPLYAALLAHYGVVADPCRVGATPIARAASRTPSSTPRAPRSKVDASTPSRRKTPGSRTGKSAGQRRASTDARR